MAASPIGSAYEGPARPPLRVAVDGRSFTDGSAVRGAGAYLRHVLAGLAAAPDTTSVVVAEGTVVVPPGVDVHALAVARSPGRLRGVARDLALSRAVATAGADVWFSPGQHPPRRSTAPVVQTLLDVIPLELPHPSLRRDRWRWRLFAPRFRRATSVIAISRHTAEAGVRHLGLRRDRMEVVPLAADESFRPSAEGQRRSDRCPNLLFVGAWSPHKGFAEACAVVAALAENGLPHRLRLVGPGDPRMRQRIAEVVARSARPDRVDQVGYVDDLPAEYQQADALIVTSRAEGFCLPAVEAMACATPVVAFDNTALPEVVDVGGTLVADGDVAAMVAALRPLLTSPRAREEAAERAVVQAKRFSWDRTVAAHVAILRAAAEQ